MDPFMSQVTFSIVRGRANRYDSSHGHSLKYLRGHRRGLRVYLCIYIYVNINSFLSQAIFPIVRVIAQSAMAAVMATAYNTGGGIGVVLEFTYSYTYTYTWILSCPRLHFPSCAWSRKPL